MKWMTGLAVFAFFVLVGAAVWMGGLNQDEGCYLYAAQLVRDGNLPYRDFSFTQGPLMPIVYSAFAGVWHTWGLLGARVLTAVFGALSVAFAVLLTRMLVPASRRNAASLVTFLLLGVNLYHLYYTAIPKTYALASLFVLMGFALLAYAARRERHRPMTLVAAGLSLAFATGTRISLGTLLAVAGIGLLLRFRTRRWDFAWFGLGGVLGLAVVYGPFLADPGARAGLVAAQRYHVARGGFDIVFTIGSLSRLVRWYLPVFIVLGLAVAGLFGRRPRPDGDSAEAPGSRLLLWGFLATFGVQILAPYPYEDYQVPVMGLLAVYAAANYLRDPVGAAQPAWRQVLLVLGLTFACAFGSPQLESWSTNGQDRFWSLKKEKTELAQLREAARAVERLDPGGKELLTQDLYLAVESNRRVPRGLEIGPFSILTDDAWRNLLETVECPVAAISGYTFAIEPPVCNERPVERQMEFLKILRRRYDLVEQWRHFGQNATTLLLLRRNDSPCTRP